MIATFFVIAAALCGGAVFAARRWRKVAAAENRVVLTGGGTGGHVNPALAIAEGLRARDGNVRFLYVGVRGKAEGVIVGKAGIPLRFVTSRGFPGLRPSLALARFSALVALGSMKAAWLLLSFAPRAVVATGGYVAAPVLFAAIALRALRVAPVRLFLHEQNAVPGQLNALLGRMCDRVFLTFPQTLSFFQGNGVVTGYPVRGAIAPISREEAAPRLPFEVPVGRAVVFAFGGSQGARTVNRAVADALPYLFPHRDRLFIIHGTGLSASGAYDAVSDTRRRIEEGLTAGQLQMLPGFYESRDYFHDIAAVYAVSDLVVCRSGAGSLNELSRLGKAAILIPKAGLPGDHQVMNARAMKHAGAAEILFEETVATPEGPIERVEGRVLAGRILALLSDRERLAALGSSGRRFLARRAVERIAADVCGAPLEPDPFTVLPFRPLFSNQRLLSMLEDAHRANPAAFDPVAAVGDEDDFAWYRHRAADLLAASRWQDRNLGVKLAGLMKNREKVPALCAMIGNRAPASRIERFLGGDFREVGFIRRNAVTALSVIGEFTPEVEAVLMSALSDPYFEVRAAACRAVARFGPRLAGKDAWRGALVSALSDEAFEVAEEAALALGEVGVDGRALDALLSLREYHHWQVRNAGLRGILRLLVRRVVPATPELLGLVTFFILTATDFRPHFAIKETFQAIERLCREGLEGVARPETSCAEASDSPKGEGRHAL